MPTFPVTYSELHVEEAVLATLQTWWHTYLGETERRHGLGAVVQRPASWQRASDFEDVDEAQFPTVAVVSPGVTEIISHGDGRVDGWVEIVVGIAVQADRRETAEKLARLHVAAARSLLLGKQLLTGELPITGMVLQAAGDYASGLVELGDRRKVNRASGAVQVAYLLEGIGWAGAGPETPDPFTPVGVPDESVTATDADLTITVA